MTLGRRKLLMGALGGALMPVATGAAWAQGPVHQVIILDFAFDPAELTVAPGDRIRFTNHDLAPHTATAQDGSWDTGTVEQGQSAEMTVTADWTSDYFCAFHPAMTARLILT